MRSGLTERVTPARDLFVLAHLGIPQVDPASWSLCIEGLIERPCRLTLEDLKALPARTVEASLQCAGNPATPAAWADAGVSSVVVSFDGGRSWSPARVEPIRGRSWQRFVIARTADVAGERELQCRAADTLGRSQPIGGARNAIHRVAIEVR